MAHSDFTNDDVEQILRVVDGLKDVEVLFESGDIKLHVRKFSGSEGAPANAKPAELANVDGSAKPVPTSAPSARAAPSDAVSVVAVEPPGTLAIRAPMLGRFYRAGSPTEPPYVEIGQRVTAADPVCIIEVMKLFNTVKAGLTGTVTSIAAENGEMVEYNQLLFTIKPD